MGLLEKLKFKSSKNTDDDEKIIIPLPLDNTKPAKKKEKLIKIKNPKLMMETIRIVQDTIFDFLSIIDLIRIRFSFKQFNGMILLYFEGRNAMWWARTWKSIFIIEDEKVSNYESNNVGIINSSTENTSTSHRYTATTKSIEEIELEYPFVDSSKLLESEAESDSDIDSDSIEETHFYGERKFTEIIVNSKEVINQLFEDRGPISETITLNYSSFGKSGKAKGSFSIPFINLIDINERVSHSFTEYEKHGKSPTVLLVESFLKTFFKILLNEWWISSTSSSSSLNSSERKDELILQKSHLSRKQPRGHDRYGPVYVNENVHTISLVYRPPLRDNNKSETIICSFSNLCHYYG